MRLNSAKNAAGSLATLIRRRSKHDIDDADYRALLYGFNTLLAYLKHVDDLRYEERLAALEERVEANR